MVNGAHPWKLVGPWYRWARAAHPADGRGAPPALQKFAGDDFIESFLADPQHSLTFDPQVDVVSRLDAAGVASSWLGRLAARSGLYFQPPMYFLAEPPVFYTDMSDEAVAARARAAAAKKLAAARYAPSALRKLFLPAHDRHYLVVCELHCDMPGFPSVPRAQACQAGFVVRRRKVDIPKALRWQADARVAALSALEADLASLQARKKPGGEAALDTLRQTVDAKRTEVGQWFADKKLASAVQGWIPGAGWTALTAEVSDTLHQMGEEFFPLVPLVPDPRAANHDAAGRTLYFGVVPTVLGDHDPDGNAHLDPASTYEIRCFARRHDASRPRPQGKPDCCGEVAWSAPTEPFRIAPPFDLIGTAQRPITIQMPDLSELAAQVKARPRGKLSPAKFVQPQHLSPNMAAMLPVQTGPGGPAICFFSIPLITIVALFLLNIFTPIVVYIFQLWHLLPLRFCIGVPQIPGNLLDAALAALPPGVDLSVDEEVANAFGAGKTAAGIKDELADRVVKGITADSHMPDKAPSANDIKAGLDTDALAGMAQAFADAARLPEDLDDPPPGLGFLGDLDYEARREAQWKLAAGGRG